MNQRTQGEVGGSSPRCDHCGRADPAQRLCRIAVGLGLGYEGERLNLGWDARMVSNGPPEHAFGAGVRVYRSALIRLGYSAEFKSWSAGLRYRGTTYARFSGGLLGTRQLAGFRMVIP